ncbi:MAG TPA: hypothetical protein VFC96_02010 [Anaerovoracaceae bacterium]|nr:hypothetical protein [Anaerovoracaceae bacterium]
MKTERVATRTEKAAKINAVKKNKKKMRKKKMVTFFLILFLCLGIIAVDNAGSELTGYPAHLSFQISKLNEEQVSISFVGKEVLINTKAIAMEVETVGKVLVGVAGKIPALNKGSGLKRDIEDIQVLLPGKTL